MSSWPTTWPRSLDSCSTMAAVALTSTVWFTLAHLESTIDSLPGIHRHTKVRRFRFLETRSFHASLIVPQERVQKLVTPLSVGQRLLLDPVSRLVRVTCASRTTAPTGSDTVPSTAAVSNWQKAFGAASRMSTRDRFETIGQGGLTLTIGMGGLMAVPAILPRRAAHEPLERRTEGALRFVAER